jgi:cyclopropane fatty-acyl-phospholipid synthase-like methyltransferase
MNEGSQRFVPALGFGRLTWLYDPILRVTLPEERIRGLLIAQARIAPAHRVLDLGCGTATLAVLLKREQPDAEVVGLDVDPAILAIARRKVAAAGLSVALHQGAAWEAPFEPHSFDRVVSSLVLHHLTSENKRRTLGRVRALLRPGGELHVADWGEARSLLMRLAFVGVQLFDGFETTADNVAGRLVPMMVEAGFVAVAETHREPTVFGTLSLYRAVAP